MGVAFALFIHSPHVNQQVIGVGVKCNLFYRKLQVILINKLNQNLKRGKMLLTETRQFHKKGDLHIYMQKHTFCEISLAKPKNEKTFRFSSLSVCDTGSR